MKKRIFITLFLVASFSLALWFWWSNSTQAVDLQTRETKIFVVQKGESIRQVARRLEGEKLIRSKLAFFLLMKSQGAEKNIQAGTFRLSASMPAEKILEELAHGTLDIWVTIIEGWRNEEIAALLEKELGLSPEEFLKAAEIGQMFPDTYAFPKEASTGTVTKMMADNFNRKFNQELKVALETQGLTEKEGIVLASIVEREAKYDEDRPMVAGILLNRLNEGMPLQADATVQYAVATVNCPPAGEAGQLSTVNCEWWPKNLTKDDLKIDSPYNTYLNVGLPPTPIANPGLAALKAASQPTKTDYLYYLSDQDGRMHYAKTLEEHNENIRKYLAK